MSEGKEGGDEKEKEGKRKRKEVGGRRLGEGRGEGSRRWGGVGGREQEVGGEGRSRGEVKEKGKEDGERRREDFICSRRYHNSALLPAECNLREFLFPTFTFSTTK